MKVEFLGILSNIEERQTKKGNRYIVLVCNEPVTNRLAYIQVFQPDKFNILSSLEKGDNISVIYETWYDKKTSKQVFLLKDILGV